MKYRVEFKGAGCKHWTEDEVFDSLTDAIEKAARECTHHPVLQHRILKEVEPEQVMFFPSMEEVIAL